MRTGTSTRTLKNNTENIHFTWECNHLATFPPSSLETERENLWSFEENVNVEDESFQSSCSLKSKVCNFSYSHIFRQNRKETHEIYKEANGKLKIQQPSSLTFPS